MTIQRIYKGWEIRLFKDLEYTINSNDNVKVYDNIYFDKSAQRYQNDSKHGITILINDEIFKSALVISSGGSTTIHNTSFIIEDNQIVICCADSVFSLSLPNLTLNWQTKADYCTCFEILEHSDAFIIHGELSISRIDKTGRSLWNFSGNDIFTTPTGQDNFRIIDDIIYAQNWDNVVFELNAYTGELLNEDFSNAGYRPH